MTSIKQLHKKFTLQQDQSDCGVSCLRNILAYYEADISLEKLREWSGTTIYGTSMLGLFEAANRSGFTAQGAQAESIENLNEVQHPCILHVTIDEKILHYIIYYPRKNKKEGDNKLLIGDPAKGLIYLSKQELEKIWVTKTVVLLEPSEKLKKWQRQKEKKIQWLWNTLKEDAHLLYIAVVLGLFAAALNLSTAVFSQRLVDDILPAGDRQRLFMGLALLGFLLIIKSLFTYLRQFLLIKQSYQFNLRLTGSFYKSILYLTKSFFDNRKTGDLIARLNDTTRIQQAVSYVLGEMAIQFLLFLVSLLFVCIYSWQIGLFCLVILPAVTGIIKYFQNDIIAQQRNVMIGHAQNESNYVDSIRGISTIKVMNRENMFINIARNIFSAFQGSVFHLGKIKNRFNIALEITGAIFLLIVIGWCSIAVLSKTMKTGEMIAIIQLAALLMQTFVFVALTNLQIQEARVALDRMYEFTAVEPEYEMEKINEVHQYSPSSIETLTLNNISFRFPGRKQLLKNISFEIDKGEIIALTGESGQGKSTILQILQKFYQQEGGSIFVNNQKLEDINTIAWRKMIAVVPQDIMIFSGTLMANICLDNSEKHIIEAQQFCKEYGFEEYFGSFPQGYATILGEGGITLSGGQKQLLALARGLYSSPSLLLLDEPTAAMDATTEHFVINLLQQLKEKMAIIIISHKDSLTKIADSVYTLQSGTTIPVQQKQYRSGMVRV